jgi:hypothetical protein
MFETPTVSGLARAIASRKEGRSAESAGRAGSPSGPMSEPLTDEDVERMLASFLKEGEPHE